MTEAIAVSALTKKYGEVDAVRGIDFEVAAGETFGFLGPNGAGKSTTIKILCTLADPTSGSARVAGHDVVRERDTVRRNIGLVFQDTTLDNYLTGEQNLRFHADLYGVPRAAFAPRLRQVLEMVGLWERRGSVVATYSGGMQRRLEIARALATRPRLLLLDEPAAGMNPTETHEVTELIGRLREERGVAILVIEHDMHVVAGCSDRVVALDHGVKIAEGGFDQVANHPAVVEAYLGRDPEALAEEA